MNEKTLSLIRHSLTMLAALLTALGLASAAGIVNFTLFNLDSVWNSILVIAGFIAGFKGFNFGRTPTP